MFRLIYLFIFTLVAIVSASPQLPVVYTTIQSFTNVQVFTTQEIINCPTITLQAETVIPVFQTVNVATTICPFEGGAGGAGIGVASIVPESSSEPCPAQETGAPQGPIGVGIPVSPPATPIRNQIPAQTPATPPLAN